VRATARTSGLPAGSVQPLPSPAIPAQAPVAAPRANEGPRTAERTEAISAAGPLHRVLEGTLGIYTHVINASHRLAIEAVEEKLFGLSDANGRKSTVAPTSTAPVSDSVN